MQVLLCCFMYNRAILGCFSRRFLSLSGFPEDNLQPLKHVRADTSPFAIVKISFLWVIFHEDFFLQWVS